MKTLLNAWNRCFFAACDPLPSAVTRIGLGFLLLYTFLALDANWERYYAADGIMSFVDHDLDDRRFVDDWNLFHILRDRVPVRAFWLLGVFGSAALLIGFCSRLASFALLALVTSMINHTPVTVHGDDMIARLLLIYGCFAPWGQALSVDAWLARHRPARTATIWPIRMMQFHILLVYVISLPYKIVQDWDWVTGEAMHWTVASDMWWVRGNMPWLTLACGGLFIKAMTWGTLLIEAAYPVLVWFPRTRLWVLAGISALHVGIALLIPGVQLFTLSMLLGAALFVPGDDYRRAAAWVRAHAAGWRPLLDGILGPAGPAQKAAALFASRTVIVEGERPA